MMFEGLQMKFEGLQMKFETFILGLHICNCLLWSAAELASSLLLEIVLCLYHILDFAFVSLQYISKLVIINW